MSAPTAAAEHHRTGRPTQLRIPALVGVAAGVLFTVMVIWQDARSQGEVDGTSPYPLIPIGFTVALVGYVILGFGVLLARPGGRSRSARVFPALLIAAWSIFALALAVEQLTPLTIDDDVTGPLGGLAQAVGLLGLGVTTAVAGRWSGWRRWYPLAMSALYLAAVFVPALLSSAPTVASEAVWALSCSGLGLALYSEASTTPTH